MWFSNGLMDGRAGAYVAQAFACFDTTLWADVMDGASMTDYSLVMGA